MPEKSLTLTRKWITFLLRLSDPLRLFDPVKDALDLQQDTCEDTIERKPLHISVFEIFNMFLSPH
jgi:hypothetical protein